MAGPTVDSERQILWETFHGNFFTHRVFASNLLRGNHRRNTFRNLFWCLASGSNPSFSSNKPTYYLLDYGDFALYFLLSWNLKHPKSIFICEIFGLYCLFQELPLYHIVFNGCSHVTSNVVLLKFLIQHLISISLTLENRFYKI